MKKNEILGQWYIKKVSSDDSLNNAFKDEISEENKWLFAGNGLQVQEVLLNYKLIDEKVLLGHTEDYQDIFKSDWIYACEFENLYPSNPVFLNFGGIDTVADVYLNSEKIASHDDLFIPLQIDICKKIKAYNRLTVYFHSCEKVAKERLNEFPDETRKLLSEVSVLRKSSIDFSDFGNVKWCKVGLFDDVTLIYPDESKLCFCNVDTDFTERYDKAFVKVKLDGIGYSTDFITAEFNITDEDNEQVSFEKASFLNAEQWKTESVITVLNPKLWWPKNYGNQPLYKLQVTLKGSSGQTLDSVTKTLGLRKIEKTGDMKFRVNHREVKFWGGNMVPMYGFTHRFNKQRCLDIIKRLAISNMNLLRIWGGGVPYDDSFYEQCDKLGIMIYQDFYLSWSYYPDTEAFRINYRKEAEYHVKRLKHHPSILLWSGGNETYMHNEENTYEKYDFGYACFREDFAWACKTYDPDRFYLESSPCGGDYPSDPSEGDGHPLYYTYRHSVEKYPVFVSESARTSTGPLRSLKQFMSEDEIWPKDYINQVTYPSTLKNREKYFSTDEKFFVPLWKKVPIPETWGKWGASFFAGESAAIEKFYEAHDAESLVYRYNMAYADFMKTYSECVRRGKPYHDLSGNRRSTGYLLWKINDTWPQFYCSLIDYFLEVYIPFYQVKRSFAPVLLSFEVDDHILLWGVNDTDKDICGNVTIKGFSMSYNRTMGEFTVPVFIRAGESKVLTDLDPICPIIREWAIFAQLVDNDNNVISRSDSFMEIERYLVFPQATIDMKIEDDELVIHTDRFAHCVELSGNEDGDEFGWLFEDNYFNLFPFEEKRIKLYGNHKKGIIFAKAHYSDITSQIEYCMDK